MSMKEVRVEVTATFKYAPGDLVDVPHLCIENGMIMLAYLGRSGGKGYRIQTTFGGRPYEAEVFEDCVCPPQAEDE